MFHRVLRRGYLHLQRPKTCRPGPTDRVISWSQLGRLRGGSEGPVSDRSSGISISLHRYQPTAKTSASEFGSRVDKTFLQALQALQDEQAGSRDTARSRFLAVAADDCAPPGVAVFAERDAPDFIPAFALVKTSTAFN